MLVTLCLTVFDPPIMHFLVEYLKIFKTLKQFVITKPFGFANYKEAFDRVEMWTVINAVQYARREYRYSNLIQSIYNRATTAEKLS